MPETTQVEIKSAWLSKVNWTQAVGVLATAIALISGNKYQLPMEVQLQIVTAIQGVQAAVTWIAKTWFTSTVTASSVSK